MASSFGIGEANRKIKRFVRTDCDYYMAGPGRGQSLNPGRVDTWMNRRGDWPGTAHIPMAQPEAIIPAAVWLAQQTATSFTGQVVELADFGVTWGPTGG